MVSGYSRAQLNEYGLLELREVSFGLSSERLRDIARFLLEMADEIDGSKPSSSWHRHLSGWSKNWSQFGACADIVVTKPTEK
jgi:hypothetical protein